MKIQINIIHSVGHFDFVRDFVLESTEKWLYITVDFFRMYECVHISSIRTIEYNFKDIDVD